MEPDDGGREKTATIPPSSEQSDGGRKRTQKRVGAKKQPATVKEEPFTGKCDDLKGHIYDSTGYKKSDAYVTTTKEIGEYVG